MIMRVTNPTLVDWRHRALGSVVALSFAGCVLLAYATEINEQTLRYAVVYAGINAGEVEIAIRQQPEGYVVASTSKLSMLAAMFLKTHASDTRFTRQQNEVRLTSGSERLRGKEKYTRSFNFDRARNRIEFSNGKSVEIKSDDRFEAAAFPLLLMLRPLDRIADTHVREVSTKRVRDYVYQKPLAEDVETPLGTLPAWKITRHRETRPSERVSVWLSRDDNPVPLKIAIIKKGKTTTLTLIEKRAGT